MSTDPYYPEGLLEASDPFLDSYRRIRAAIRPPMARLAALDFGELWYYGGSTMAVASCIGERSLLVAYDIQGPRALAIEQFRDAQAWLDGACPRAPRGLHLMFAAKEEPSGRLFVRRAVDGDWYGITAGVTEPTPDRRLPRGWECEITAN